MPLATKNVPAAIWVQVVPVHIVEGSELSKVKYTAPTGKGQYWDRESQIKFYYNIFILISYNRILIKGFFKKLKPNKNNNK